MYNNPQFAPQFPPQQHAKPVVYVRPDNHGGCCANCGSKTRIGLVLYVIGWVLLVAGLAVTWWFEWHRSCRADKCDASRAWLAFGVLGILFSFFFVLVCLIPLYPNIFRTPFSVAAKLPLIGRILQVLAVLFLVLCMIMSIVTNGMEPDTFGSEHEDAAVSLTVIGGFIMIVAIVLMGLDFFGRARAFGIPVAAHRSAGHSAPAPAVFQPQPQFNNTAFQPSNAPPRFGGGHYGPPPQYRSW